MFFEWTRLGFAAQAVVLAGAITLGGCMHVPIMTVYKLWSFDLSTANPAMLGAAVRAPAVIDVRPGGAKLVITLGAKGTGREETHSFALEASTNAADIAALSKWRRSGDAIHAFRLSKSDVERVRTLQALHKAKGSSGPKQLTVEVAADTCHTAALPPGRILITTYLKVDPVDGFLPLLEDVDLRQSLGTKGVAEQLPKCGPA